MVPRGSGGTTVNEGAPGRSGGVSIRVAITVFAGPWGASGESRGEPAAPGRPRGLALRELLQNTVFWASSKTYKKHGFQSPKGGCSLKKEGQNQLSKKMYSWGNGEFGLGSEL